MNYTPPIITINTINAFLNNLLKLKINLKSPENTIVKLGIFGKFINILETGENHSHYKTARLISL